MSGKPRRQRLRAKLRKGTATPTPDPVSDGTRTIADALDPEAAERLRALRHDLGRHSR